ncbi:MAG: polyribonucleotide nucleotidyltransferase [Candidatus Colwellbacteria bacterium]|nr:polyribonucleotide nucleotidyltransferase [Candidatus Colwellbacteria bacterium]
MNLERKQYEVEVAGKVLKLESSRLAEQANGAVLATYGGTAVLATVVMNKEDRDIDFMPLVVDYEEKFYAIGKILGGQYIRREGRPSQDAVLAGRLIDRAIRPLFDQRLRRDIQVTATILSYDEENSPAFVALMAVSAALGISDIPWGGPVAGISVAKFGSDIVLNPTVKDLTDRAADKKFSSFLSGVGGKLNMIELEGMEADEAEVIDAYEKALKEIDRLVETEKKMILEIGKKKMDVALRTPAPELVSAVKDFLSDKLSSAVYVADRKDRDSNLYDIEKALIAHISEKGFSEKELSLVEGLLNNELDELVHKEIIENDHRPDGRKLDEIRELGGEVGLLPRTHGSSVFIRGNTQALATVTLAAPGQEKVIETIEHMGKQRFMLHYNFPGYSVGEAKTYRGPGRRDIGHGALAEKTVKAMMPDEKDFPYVVRVVSEILSSNGSSSMATVCAASLALMDAGVPMKKPVAGIAMGLMSSSDGRYKVLTDIQGPEDHHGDMDFKVAGTRDGVNAIQMDVKIEGIAPSVLLEGLHQAKKARLQILDVIASILPAPRPGLSDLAPRVETLMIDPSRIGEVIGPGGKIINGIIARTGVDINIEDTGEIYISARDKNALAAGIAEIRSIVREFKVGEVVEGNIIRILDFGAIVDLGGGKDGMIHVSELKEGFVKNVTDVVSLGDFVRAKIIKAEDGKIGLSIKQLSKE